MRTTLDIDDGILIVTKEWARHENVSAGQGDTPASASLSIAGFRPFTMGNTIVTNDAVNRLRESEGV